MLDNSFVPIRRKMVLQKDDRNLLSRSEMMAWGIPQSWPISVVIVELAQSWALLVVLPGISKIRLLNLSVIVSSESNPSAGGSATMKSIAIVWNGIGGVWIDCKLPYGRCRFVWFSWH